MPPPSTAPTLSKPSTVTRLFDRPALSADKIQRELDRLGDSSTPPDCLLRTALLELLTLRNFLAEERALVDQLEHWGLQTLSSIYGVHCTSEPPGFRRKWICWRGRQHGTLREAIRESIQIQKAGRK